MGYLTGVHLLPSTGEFTYDTEIFNLIASWTVNTRTATPPLPALPFIETYFTTNLLQTANKYNEGADADYTLAMDQLVAAHPECATVSMVCAWFGDSTDISACQIYPSTIHNGSLYSGPSGWEFWQVSSIVGSNPIQFDPGANGSIVTVSANPINYGNNDGLTLEPSPNPIIIPISRPDGVHAAYGGTPSDASVVRCVRDLKARGFRVIFYPFLLMDCTGYPWRGRITYTGADVSSAATAAVSAFLGPAATSDFARDPTNLTVDYSGSLTDYTYRRMILHYANLMVIAGGVDLFIIGSELRGMETIRGPAWTKAGTTDGSGNAVWDYPFVAGLVQLASDVRSVFDAAGYAKNLSTLTNLVAYSADWSDWMGYQHPGENGQWPHLDPLWASSNIDIVGLDNYTPLSDWTTGEAGLDVVNWQAPAPAGSWPPSPSNMNGLALTGPPTIYSIPYLQANIEGGEKFNWFYNDGTNGGPALDPNGSAEIVSQPQGDRAAQSRSPYYANQQILANKQWRWWWNNLHYAVYANGSGAWVPQGPRTEWVPNSKSLMFLEYGVPSCDKGTNQPNVFFAPASVESFTPYWSEWLEVSIGQYIPARDDTISTLALQAVYQYWNVLPNNESVAGVVMVTTAFCCVWNWDARPFPVFPILESDWGDAGNWQAGNWLNGRGPALPPVAPSPAPTPGVYQMFPTLATLGWSSHVKPRFFTDVVDHVSGRSSRRPHFASAYYDVELTFDLLRSAASYLEMQEIAGFFSQIGGAETPFWLAPPSLATVVGQALGIGDGVTTTFPLQRAYGGYSEPVYGTSGVSALYLNGALISSAVWSVSSGYAPVISFTTPPAPGVAVSADFGVLWLCRFTQDVLDFEEFMAMLFELGVVKLTTTKP